jgi:UDP-N-acetylglucosamine acyltransferase
MCPVKGESKIEKVHPTAILHKGAEIEADVEIGPYSIIGEHVHIGAGTVIGSQVLIDGWTTIGSNCKIYHGAALGTPPQDHKYKGLRSYVRIGDGNLIREFVTIHCASQEEAVTSVGDGNFLMAYVHIGHNCVIGNYNTLANLVNLAGHIEIEDRAVIGGMTGFHQFVRVGSMAMVGGYARVVKDVPPYSLVAGQPACLFGINTIGLKRQHVNEKIRADIKKAYKIVIRKNRLQAIEEIKETIEKSREIEHLLDFLEHPSKMGIILRRGEDPEVDVTTSLNIGFFE